jgi:hypothetical protein
MNAIVKEDTYQGDKKTNNERVLLHFVVMNSTNQIIQYLVCISSLYCHISLRIFIHYHYRSVVYYINIFRCIVIFI